MKINYSLVINQPDGTPYIDNETKVPLTLKSVIVASCSQPVPGDENMDPVAKYQIGEIGICAYKELDLSTEQVAKVKVRIAKLFTSPVLVYQANQLLEDNHQH